MENNENIFYWFSR